MPRTTKVKSSQPLTTAQRLSSIVKSCRDVMRKDKGLNGDLDRLPMLTWIMFLTFLDDMEEIRQEEAKMAGQRFRPAIDTPYRWRDWAAKEDRITGDELIALVNNEEAVRPDGTKGAGQFRSTPLLIVSQGGDGFFDGRFNGSQGAQKRTAWDKYTYYHLDCCRKPGRDGALCHHYLNFRRRGMDVAPPAA